MKGLNMPDDARTDEDDEPEAPGPAHDDIMKRLLDYQQQLREGVEPSEAAGSTWPAVTEASEPESQPTTVPTDLHDVSATRSEIEAEPEATDAIELEPATTEEPELEVATGPIEPESAIGTAEPVSELPTAEEVGVPESEAPATEGAAMRHEPAARTDPDVEERIARLEATLDRLGNLLGELRGNFQQLAVAADERIAAIEGEVAETKDRTQDES